MCGGRNGVGGATDAGHLRGDGHSTGRVSLGLRCIMTTESYPPEQNYVHRPCRRPQSRRPQASLQRSQLFPQSRRAEERNMHQPRLPIDRRKSQDDHSIEYHIEYHSKSINQTPTPLTTSPTSHPFPSNLTQSHHTKPRVHPSPEGKACQPAHPPSDRNPAAQPIMSRAKRPLFWDPRPDDLGPRTLVRVSGLPAGGPSQTKVRPAPGAIGIGRDVDEIGGDVMG